MCHVICQDQAPIAHCYMYQSYTSNRYIYTILYVNSQFAYVLCHDQKQLLYELTIYHIILKFDIETVK
jgi:hypothetical protein